MGKHNQPVQLQKPIPLNPPPRPLAGKHEGKDKDQKPGKHGKTPA